MPVYHKLKLSNTILFTIDSNFINYKKVGFYFGAFTQFVLLCHDFPNISVMRILRMLLKKHV